MPGARGISEGNRYAKQAALVELYLQMIPEDRPLARELAHEDETEVFNDSSSLVYYGDKFRTRLISLNLQVQFAKTLKAPT
jgi:hypothetical protein